ncbi:MAG: hypothetical protein HQL24_03440 [Candidatus Omnitrophica bacterium]|nr:hypothetical protein [Candidatus Omnitrophota bacterium]
MIIFSVIISIVFLVAIIWINSHSQKPETSLEFMKRVEKLTEGKSEPILGEENAQRIRFSFEGEEFLFEYFLIKGLEQEVEKAFLKIETQVPLTIQSTEKKQRSVMTQSSMPGAVKNSQASMPYAESLHVPPSLRDLEIYTNKPALVNKLFDDRKVVRVLDSFKNTNAQGFTFLSLKVLTGTIILEFSPLKSGHPNLLVFKRDIHSLENYADQLLLLARKIKSLL